MKMNNNITISSVANSSLSTNNIDCIVSKVDVLDCVKADVYEFKDLEERVNKIEELLRPVAKERAENPNQKSDLEILKVNGENILKPINLWYEKFI